MPSQNILMINHPEKMKAGPAAIKESRKIGDSLADMKKPKIKTVAGKAGQQHKKKEAAAAKTEPLHIAPGKNDDLNEVVNELDSKYVLDVEDIVLEEHEDTEDKD